MSFCPICSSSYNISKSIESTNIQTGGKFNEEDIIRLIIEKKDINNNILAEINLKELKKKQYFKKLNTDER